MRDLIMQIALYTVQLFILATLTYAISYLKQKLGNEKTAQAYNLVKNIVLAVEQSLGPGKGADKKQEAIAYIKKLLGNTLSDDEINVLIEAAVKEMNMVLKQKGIVQ
jgi:LL-H family phage holin